MTPFVSWIRSLDDTFERDVDFFYTVPEERDALFLDEIRAAAEHYPSLRVHPVFSRSERRLTPQKVAQTTKFPVTDAWIYLCGPTRMMQRFKSDFLWIGVPSGRIRREEFDVR